MARPSTGAPRWNAAKGYWEARVMINGKREPAPLRGIPKCVAPAPCSFEKDKRSLLCASCTQARRVAKTVSDKYRRDGYVPEETGETANEWHVRYLERHKELGRQTRDMAGAWERWLAQEVGAKPLSAVTREQIIRVRDALTRAVERGEISAKRVLNIWSDIVKAPFSRAFTDDDPRYSSVRVGPESANPAVGVKPPVTKEQLDNARRERQPLFPNEFIRLLNAENVPVVARRIYVIATYLFARPQELYALRWSDVDWDAGEVRIRRKLDVRTDKEVPGTKSDAGIREIPIHDNLMPLLKVMREGAKPTDRIIPIEGAARMFERFADQTRQNLALANIERTELLAGTVDFMPFDFRSWRTTGCTWHAMLGTDSYVLATWTGHKSPETTWASYIKRGPDLRRRHGEPFPPLPEELLGPISGPSGSGRELVSGPIPPNDSHTLQRRGRDSKLAAGRPKLSVADEGSSATRSSSGPVKDEVKSIATRPATIATVPTIEPTVLVRTEQPEPRPAESHTDVESALSYALTEAAKAGRFDVVGQLARELEARRLTPAGNVVRLRRWNR